MGLAVVFKEVAGHPVDLHGQLAGGGDDDGARAVPRHEFGVVHQLHAGDQKRQRLASSGNIAFQRWPESQQNINIAESNLVKHVARSSCMTHRAKLL